jgi:hypothetical protein
MALVSWIQSICFPDLRPLQFIALIDAANVPLLHARLGHKHSGNLIPIVFADHVRATLMWRFCHPSQYTIGVDTSVASLVLGIRRQPNLAILSDNNTAVLNHTPEAFSRCGFVLTPQMLDAGYFASCLEAAAAGVFPHLPRDQLHRVLFGELLPAPLAIWANTPELRPIVLSSAPVQRLIHNLPPNLLRMNDGRAYDPPQWKLFASVDQMLRLSEDNAFLATVAMAPFLICNEDAENLCQINVIEACRLRTRLTEFSVRFNKAVVIMVRPTPTSDKMCERKENDLGLIWCTHADLLRTKASITVEASSRHVQPPPMPQMRSTTEQRHFNSMVAQLARPMSGAERLYAECALRESMNRSSRLGQHELKELHTSAKFAPSGLTYSTHV